MAARQKGESAGRQNGRLAGRTAGGPDGRRTIRQVRMLLDGWTDGQAGR